MNEASILTNIAAFLASPRHLMTEEAKREFMTTLFFAEKQGSFFTEIPTYRDETKVATKKIAEKYPIPLTDEYGNDELEEPSIAYYRIKGPIMAESRWWFSTKQFREDMLEAENNPLIMAHFVHVNSGGGDAWYLDVAAATMKNLQKPVVAYIERVSASAGIYLILFANNIVAATPNETLGSVGTMVAFLDVIPYFEKLGAKYYEEYASESDLKNKKFNDLLKGKPEKFITDELDPLRNQFVEAVKTARPATAKLDNKHPLFRGETFGTEESISLGLIDGQMLMEEALADVYDRGQKHLQKLKKRNSAIQLIN